MGSSTEVGKGERGAHLQELSLEALSLQLLQHLGVACPVGCNLRPAPAGRVACSPRLVAPLPGELTRLCTRRGAYWGPRLLLAAVVHRHAVINFNRNTTHLPTTVVSQQEPRLHENLSWHQ